MDERTNGHTDKGRWPLVCGALLRMQNALWKVSQCSQGKNKAHGATRRAISNTDHYLSGFPSAIRCPLSVLHIHGVPHRSKMRCSIKCERQKQTPMEKPKQTKSSQQKLKQLSRPIYQNVRQFSCSGHLIDWSALHWFHIYLFKWFIVKACWRTRSWNS